MSDAWIHIACEANCIAWLMTWWMGAKMRRTFTWFHIIFFLKLLLQFPSQYLRWSSRGVHFCASLEDPHWVELLVSWKVLQGGLLVDQQGVFAFVSFSGCQLVIWSLSIWGLTHKITPDYVFLFFLRCFLKAVGECVQGDILSSLICVYQLFNLDCWDSIAL